MGLVVGIFLSTVQEDSTIKDLSTQLKLVYYLKNIHKRVKNNKSTGLLKTRDESI
jgi:hypothetical protein